MCKQMFSRVKVWGWGTSFSLFDLPHDENSFPNLKLKLKSPIFFVALFSKKRQIFQLFTRMYQNESGLWKIWLREVKKKLNLSLLPNGFAYIIWSGWENRTFVSFFMSFLRLARKTLKIKILLLINYAQSLFCIRLSS